MDKVHKVEKPKTQEELNRLYKDTFSTDAGMKCLELLKMSFVDRPVYIKGMSLDEVAFREGGRDLVNQILKVVENGR